MIIGTISFMICINLIAIHFPIFKSNKIPVFDSMQIPVKKIQKENKNQNIGKKTAAIMGGPPDLSDFKKSGEDDLFKTKHVNKILENPMFSSMLQNPEIMLNMMPESGEKAQFKEMLKIPAFKNMLSDPNMLKMAMTSNNYN